MVWVFLESRQIFKFDKFQKIKGLIKFKNSACESSENYRIFSALLFIYETLAVISHLKEHIISLG